jgi:hypothetical protein
MLNAQKLHVHIGGSDEIHSCELQAELTLRELAALLIAAGKFSGEAIEAIFFFEEDDDDELPAAHRVGPAHHGKRLHAHLCREINVTLLFADEKRNHSFRPGATIGKVLRWAVHHFPVDQNAKYVLRLTADGEPLAHATHLGSLVKGGHCSVTLYFAPTCRIQG